MNDKYILDADGKTPIPVDLMEWARWFEANQDKRRVACDEFDGVKVSTVFLGLDHRFSSVGDPVLWETMIFGGPHAEYQERYTSHDAAVAGHAKALAMARETVAP